MNATETAPISVPDFALVRGFHRMRANDCAREIKAIYNACPVVEFADLKPGAVVSHETSGGGYLSRTDYNIHRVVRHTPSGVQCVMVPYGKTYETKLDRRTVSGKFRELSDDMVAMIGVSHRMIVEEAASQGLDVPPIVRREYPELFVDIPGRFGLARPHYTSRTTEVERAKDSMFQDDFHRNPTTARTVLGWIDAAHGKIQEAADHAIRGAATNPEVSEDFDRYMDEFADHIDFYRWLLPLVSEGGVFYCEPTDETEDDR